MAAEIARASKKGNHIRAAYLPGQPEHPDTIISDDLLDVQPVLFESLDATMIRSAVLYTGGVGGPSGLDAIS